MTAYTTIPDRFALAQTLLDLYAVDAALVAGRSAETLETARWLARRIATMELERRRQGIPGALL